MPVEGFFSTGLPLVAVVSEITIQKGLGDDFLGYKGFDLVAIRYLIYVQALARVL